LKTSEWREVLRMFFGHRMTRMDANFLSQDYRIYKIKKRKKNSRPFAKFVDKKNSRPFAPFADKKFAPFADPLFFIYTAWVIMVL